MLHFRLKHTLILIGVDVRQDGTYNQCQSTSYNTDRVWIGDTDSYHKEKCIGLFFAFHPSMGRIQNLN